MHAHVGDWLVVPEVPGSAHARRGLIVAVSHADGSPPFRVRWLDDEHETLLFPPPDAHLQRHAAMPGTVEATPLTSRSSSSGRPGETGRWSRRRRTCGTGCNELRQTRLVAGRSGPPVRRS
jgi:hypothetical protein